jgi:peptidoglycan-N-acetylglucosamine deacetylase
MIGKPAFFECVTRLASRLQAIACRIGIPILIVFSTMVSTVSRSTSADGFDQPTSSIRCTWAPRCAIGRAITDMPTAHPKLLRTASTLVAQPPEKERELRARRPQTRGIDHRPVRDVLRGPLNRPLSIGFYVNWDKNSYQDLKRELPRLDWVIPSWLFLQGPNLDLKSDIDDRVLEFMRTKSPKMPILPMVQNATGQKWDGPGLARLLSDRPARAARLESIIAFLEANGFQGVTIDFEEVPPKAQKDLHAFLSEMSQALAEHGLATVLAVPFDDNGWPYKAYGKIVDYLLLMAYDQHSDGSAPGSVAGQDWFERTLDKHMQMLGPNRTIVAIGGYGYDWIKGNQTQVLTFQDAVLSARDSESDIEFDPDNWNPHFSYIEDEGHRHDVWFLDAVTAYNQIKVGNGYRLAGYALWRLGSEDPSVWSVMGQPYDAVAPSGLKVIASGEDTALEGEGEILRVAQEPAEGARTLDIDDKTGQIVEETYETMPTPFVIERTSGKPGELALTFNDGPDPEWTRKILDTLRSKGVHATFFIVGEKAEAYPGLVKRILDEGHDVGNHTFTHADLGEVPQTVVKSEINSTQRLFEALTGRSMRLFRPPFLGDAGPTTANEAAALQIAQSMGYLIIDPHVDPHDRQVVSADVIVQRVLGQVAQGQIILLHDSGGDRSQTLAALPRLIDALREKGYEFVTVSELAGLTPD